MALILVTGARGGIGRHVVALAKRRGHVVAGLGHGLWAGDPDLPAIDYWLNGDVVADNLRQVERNMGSPDAVIHLAGGALVGASVDGPAEDFRRTVEGGQRLLEWHRTEVSRARIVIASSAAVYGDSHSGPIPESAAMAPRSPYGTHKAVVEMLARSYGNQFAAPISIVRLFSVYGPGLRKQLVWDIATRLTNGERRISLGGSGDELRDFVYVEDAASLLLDAVPTADPAVPVFNGCTGRGTKTSQIARQVGEFFDGAAFEFSGRARAGDPFSLVGDPALASSFGLSPTISQEAGIAATIEWVRRSYHSAVRR